MLVKIKNSKGKNLQVTLDHREMSLWDNDINITSRNKEAVEAFMGCYIDNNDAWTFPSPIDAIRLFKKLPDLVSTGKIKFSD